MASRVRLGLLAAGIGASLALALPAWATAANVQGDFNGDGYADLAVGVPGKTVQGTSEWGVVHVIYGSRHGLTSKGDRIIHFELPGTHAFGETLATGDFDGDGHADLAVGAPFSSVLGHAGAGFVAVFYGTNKGLPLHKSQLLTQGEKGMPGIPEDGDVFGNSLAAANFGHGKPDDLAIGARNEDGRAGEVDVVYGSSHGLRTHSGAVLNRATPGVPGDPTANETLGDSLSAGKLRKGKTADLAVGVTGTMVEGVADAGSALVLFSGRKGLTGAGSEEFSAATPGVPGDPAGNSGFGRSVAVGDFGRGRTADLAIGAPFVGNGVLNGTGEITVLYGTRHGPATAHARLLTMGSGGLPPAAQSDAIGRELAAGDLGRDRHADLISSSERSVAGEDSAGAIVAIFGSKKGLTGKHSKEIDRTSPGVGGDPVANAYFGTTLSIGAYAGPGTQVLAVGVPDDEVDSVTRAGSVNLLHYSKGTLRGKRVLAQGRNGLAGTAEGDDYFGAALSFRNMVGLFD